MNRSVGFYLDQALKTSGDQGKAHNLFDFSLSLSLLHVLISLSSFRSANVPNAQTRRPLLELLLCIKC